MLHCRGVYACETCQPPPPVIVTSSKRLSATRKKVVAKSSAESADSDSVIEAETVSTEIKSVPRYCCYTKNVLHQNRTCAWYCMLFQNCDAKNLIICFMGLNLCWMTMLMKMREPVLSARQCKTWDSCGLFYYFCQWTHPYGQLTILNTKFSVAVELMCYISIVGHINI